MARAKAARPYLTDRAKAWRNLLVAAINAGLERGLFGLEPGDDRWPAEVKDGRREPYVFPFEIVTMSGEMPVAFEALGCVEDISHGELAVRAVFFPTDAAAHWLRVVTDPAFGSRAGAAFAMGWLERQRGKYLQDSRSLFRCSPLLVPSLARANVEPVGFADHGEIIL